MLDITTDIQSLTAFRRTSGAMMKTLKRTQRLLDIAARAEAEEGIRQGLEDAKNGKTRSARQFFTEFESARPA